MKTILYFLRIDRRKLVIIILIFSRGFLSVWLLLKNQSTVLSFFPATDMNFAYYDSNPSIFSFYFSYTS